MAYDPDERVSLEDIIQVMPDAAIAPMSKKIARVKWTRALKGNCSNWMKDLIRREMLNNSRREGYGFDSMNQITENWAEANTEEERSEMADKLLKMITTRCFEQRMGMVHRSWKYKAEEDYINLKKMKYPKKELKNGYDGCISRQASRALDDINKQLNPAAKSTHGYLFSIKGRNEKNKSTFVAIKKMAKSKARFARKEKPRELGLDC
jgi:hypothetical protein